jgi:PAS domain-containing protein
LEGLRTVISRSWPTQSEFAEGVTSKVNLSNILRGNSGVSAKMIDKLSEKAGLSVSDILEMGKGAVKTRASDNIASKNGLSTFVIDPYVSSTDLTKQAAEYTSRINEQVMYQVKSVVGVINDFVKERERLLTELTQYQSWLNIVSRYVFIINTENEVTYCNTQAQKHFNLSVGSIFQKEDHEFFESTDILDQVIVTDKPAQQTIEYSGLWWFCRALPLTNIRQETEYILISIQSLNTILPLSDEQIIATDKEVI